MSIWSRSGLLLKWRIQNKNSEWARHTCNTKNWWCGDVAQIFTILVYCEQNRGAGAHAPLIFHCWIPIAIPEDGHIFTAANPNLKINRNPRYMLSWFSPLMVFTEQHRGIGIFGWAVDQFTSNWPCGMPHGLKCSLICQTKLLLQKNGKSLWLLPETFQHTQKTQMTTVCGEIVRNWTHDQSETGCKTDSIKLAILIDCGQKALQQV